MQTTVSVIIVHHNTPKQLTKLLSMLQGERSIEAIVVDNASEHVPSKRKQIVYISNKVNRGYAFACNQGATIAKGEWVVFLNPDMEITPQDIFNWIEKTKNQNFLASSPISSTENYSKPVPSVVSLLGEFTPLKWVLPRSIFPNKTLIGGALLIRKMVLFEMGGWDERFFLWFEDSDLTKRLLEEKIPFGFVNVAHKHRGGSSFTSWSPTQKSHLFFHAMQVYAKKHFSSLGQFIVNRIQSRYSSKKILPVLQDGISITVPNILGDQLSTFLSENKKKLEQFEELVIVTSGLPIKNVWTYRSKHKNARIIPIAENKGFASTVNIGFRTSTFSWTGTINDDVTIQNPIRSWISNQLEKKVGSLNPVIYTTKGTIESAGIQILPKGKAHPIETPSEKEIKKVDATNGAAVIYSHKVLEKVGIFDERFGSYLEDIDLSLRLSRNGYLNVVNSKTKVIHSKHATSSKTLKGTKEWLDFKNWIFVILKNWGTKKMLLYSPHIIVERVRNISGILKS